MEFAFTNSTFSFIVAFVAAILGITSPLLIDNISKIDDKYRASIITTHFQEECVYRLYQKLLVPTISIVFIIPFLLLIVKNLCCIIVVLVIQCILLLGLVITLLYLLHVIIAYLNPIKLAERLFPDEDGNKTRNLKDYNLLNIAVELMRYSCKKPNSEVYKKCVEFVYGFAMSELKSKKINSDNELKEISLSDEVWDALIRLTNYSADTRLVPLCNENFIAEILYQPYLRYRFSEKCYNKMWYALYLIIQSKNIEWFKQYWAKACQYYTFEINSQPNIYLHTNEGKENNDRYLEFHFMVGALVLQCDKYDSLNFMMSYDHVTPPNYYLVPSSFSKIMEMVKQLEAYLNYSKSHKPLELTSKYQMKDMFHDINSDEKIIMWGYRYAALLMVRIQNNEKYNVVSYHFETEPNTNTSDIQYLEQVKAYANRLKNEIDVYCRKLVGKVDFGFSGDDITQASDIVKKYIEELESTIKKIKDKLTVDICKLEELRKQLVEIDNGIEALSVAPTESDGKPIYSKTVSFDCGIDVRLCTNEYDYGWNNFADVAIHGLQENTKIIVNDIFHKSIEVKKEINVSSYNLFQVLDSFGLEKGYVIMVYGIRLPFMSMDNNVKEILRQNDEGEYLYKGCNVVHNPSLGSFILIVQETDLPKIEYVGSDSSHDFNGVSMTKFDGSNNHLYSNLDSIIKESAAIRIDEKTKIPAKIGRCINIYLKEKIEAVRINVVFSGNDTESLDNIKPISSYFTDK